MARTQEPQVGDIAIIDGPAGPGVPVGAIRTARGGPSSPRTGAFDACPMNRSA